MILVAGENVIDLIGVHDGLLQPTCGGGPANTAVALAKRGIPSALVGAVGSDAFAQGIWRRHTNIGVDTTFLQRTALSSTLALATVGGDGQASYDFWTQGTADFAWEAVTLPEADPRRFDVVHFGSLAAYIEPSASIIEGWIQRVRRRLPISFDPNIRLGAMGKIDEVRERTEKLVGLSHLVRCSDDDIAAIYPGRTVEEVAKQWLEVGPELVVVTLGVAGAIAFHRRYTLPIPGLATDVVDTIGAGDVFTSGLLGWLTSAGWMAIDRIPAWGNKTIMTAALRYATQLAAQSTTVPGAP